MKKLLTLLLAVLLLAGCAGNKSGTFEAGKNTFLLNGKPFVVKAAAVSYTHLTLPTIYSVNTGNIVSKCVKPWA